MNNSKTVNDLSTREKNRLIILNDKSNDQIIKEIHKTAEFMGDFGSLSLGRDYILCQDKVFSLQSVCVSCELTVGSILNCCESGCMADSFTLLRKYRDDLFFYLYVMVYNAYSKLNEHERSNGFEKMGENISHWIKSDLRNLQISTILKTIGGSPFATDAVQNYHLKPAFDKIDRRLNNYVHGNGLDFYNRSYYHNMGDDLHKQMHELLGDLRYITVTFLFLLTLCNPLSIMSTDYVDYLEFNMTPPEGSQYWVAPFIKDYFRDNIDLIDDNCIQYLRENTSMEI